MKLGAQKGHLRLVASCGGAIASPPPPSPPIAASSITLEISAAGALQRLDINLRPEDALQALNGLVMAHMRALALIPH